MFKKPVVWLIAALLAAGGLTYIFQKGTDKPAVSVVVPGSFSAAAMAGEVLFSANCATCHGKNAAGGTGNGPPLVHIIYEPNHHGDGSFYRAVAHGVRAHHWPFGNMPAIAGVSEADVTKIIAYVRELQRANGIR